MSCITRERLLDTISEWESGERDTPGQPRDGQNYGLVMRQNVKALETELAAHVRGCEHPVCIADRPYWDKREKKDLNPA